GRGTGAGRTDLQRRRPGRLFAAGRPPGSRSPGADATGPGPHDQGRPGRHLRTLEGTRDVPARAAAAGGVWRPRLRDRRPSLRHRRQSAHARRAARDGGVARPARSRGLHGLCRAAGRRDACARRHRPRQHRARAVRAGDCRRARLRQAGHRQRGRRRGGAGRARRRRADVRARRRGGAGRRDGVLRRRSAASRAAGRRGAADGASPLRCRGFHARVSRCLPTRRRAHEGGDGVNARANVMNGPPQSVAGAAPARIPWGFAELFILSQTVLPAILILPGTQGMRLPIRASAFLLPLAAFVWWNINSEINVRPSRAQSWFFAVMFLLSVMLFHTQTPSFVGGLAHLAVYFAVMTPLFWATAFVKSPEHLARIRLLPLVCSGINAIVGVLHVYDPQRWMPAEFSRVALSGLGLGPVSYVGPNGRVIVRPPGLFDTPGSVAGPAAYAALLGLVFAVSAIPAWKRLLSLLFAGAGLAAIYLSQVRISL